MRLIGHLQSEASAKTFGGYLSSLNIRNMVEPDPEGWAVWVYSEDQIETGSNALTAFLQNPSDRSFQAGAQLASAAEDRQRKEEAAFSKRVRTADQIFKRSDTAPLTLVLIGASVVVTLFTGLGVSFATIRWLLISNTDFGFLPEVRSGQVWRLITPIFIHFGLQHLLFNMWVLYDLGRMIEMIQGTKRLLLLVIIIGIGSNVGQYLIGGPGFGGMSGVLYGMVGYIWIRSICDPGSGLSLSPMTIGIMLVWFFLCIFKVIPNVANGTHAVGLIMGMIWGALPMVKGISRT
jgi:GlpG protein